MIFSCFLNKKCTFANSLKKKFAMKKVLLILTFFSLIIKISGQVPFESVRDSVANQLIAYPQEKIHLHTDRNYYVPGEKIWFKTYLVDAETHQMPTKSQYVYVELTNSSDSLVERVMIRKSPDNMFYGNIFLSEVVSEGLYTLRAYTRYMNNMGDEYFFKKNIRIGKLDFENKEGDRKKKKKSANKDYEVTFYPEGGNLQEGKLCAVAFKALNESGRPDSIAGTVVDGEGALICDVNTYYSGMGSFVISVEKNKEYFLKCTNEKGLEKKFKLPQVRNNCSIKASWTGANWFVSVNKSSSFTEQELYLLVHCRGNVLYFASWNHTKEYLSFSKKQFPKGVIQILLLDGNMNPLSERLIFNKNDSDTKLAFSADKTFYGKREKVNIDIHVTDNEGIALSGNLSVAITDDKDIQTDTTTTILSSLLLSSELKGYIDNPAFYLLDNPKAVFALDLLMMTHGWRRYDIPEVIKGKKKYPEYAFEETKYVAGQVKSFLLEKPVENGEVTMLSSAGGFGVVTTNSMGYFGFFGFDYPDSTKFFIKANNKKGSERVLLFVNPETFPQLQHIPDILNDIEEDTIDDAFLKKAEQRAQYDEDMRVINLPEVVIQGKKPMIAKRDEVRLQNWANAGSDATIYREDIEKRHAHRVIDLLMTVAGVRVTGNGSVTIRGASGPPLVLIDGVEAEWDSSFSPLEMVDVDDVESIDVFKGANAAVFGMKGGNGAISITTRRGSTDIASKPVLNYASISPIGFQKPVEYYSPKYDTSESKRSGVPDYRTTIFWKPDILTSGDGKASFEFFTADFSTTYSVVIEGISSDGHIIRQVEKIEVK
jgi:TonB-dependent SusC/RagA subfamily outer membrane receptor